MGAVARLEEIAVEKLAALMDRARNEPRDLYDLWVLTAGEHVDLAMLVSAIEDREQAGNPRTQPGGDGRGPG